MVRYTVAKVTILFFVISSLGLVLTAQTTGEITAMDSLTAIDSTIVVQYDTLKPIFTSQLVTPINKGAVKAKEELNFTDYIYSGNWLNYLPFGYLQNSGVLGVPNEISIYSFGNSDVGLLVDGIDFGDRTGAGIDLYEIRSETIDTVEYLSPDIAFVNSLLNYNAGLNFVTRDKIAVKPLTRIRYYQAANDEGYIDGQFNLYPVKRLNISAGITNSSVASDYNNSEYGNWKASVKARYLFNNTFNFIFNYYYTNINAQLNGGVDYNKIAASGGASSVIYSAIEAPVVFENRYQKTTNHKLHFRTLINLIKDNPASVDIYYFAGLKEFRQNENKSSSDYLYIKNNNRSKTFGISARQKFALLGFGLNLSAAYENNNYNLHSIKSLGSYSTASASVSLAKKYFKKVEHSIYSKYLRYQGNSYLSVGTAVKYELSENFAFFAGYSELQKPLSVLQKALNNSYADNTSRSYDFGVSWGSDAAKLKLSYFSSSNTNNTWFVIDAYEDTLKTHTVTSAFYGKANRAGVNLYGSAEVWNVLFELNSSYFIENNADNIVTVPEWIFAGGVYYVDTLFNRNLNLKTGVNIYAQGRQSFRIYDFEKMLTAYHYTDANGALQRFNDKTTESVQVDLFLSGMIRNRAIVYLVLENVLNAQYFTIPYYPRKGINFRFGIAWELYN